MNWDLIKATVLSNMDIRAEAVAIGIEFTATEPNADGWLTCWAFDRPHGDSPNAGVNVASDNGALGRYHDFGGDGEKLSFFDLAAKLGKFPDWQAALKHYAEGTGVVLPSSNGKKKNKRPAVDQIKFLPDNDIDLTRWAKAKSPVTLEAVKAAGAKLCKWPAKAKSESQFLCVAFPAYRATQEASGWILYRVNGEDFPAMGDKLTARKTHNLRGSKDGWVYVGGEAAFKAASVIWKTEGIPDALAIFPHLPDGHAVATNIAGAGGAAKCPLAHWKNKRVNAIGDADKTGQAGVATFANAVARYSDDVRNIQLPYPATADHGKDLRDYFAEGNTFADLLSAAEAAEPVKHEPMTIKERQDAGMRHPVEITPDEFIAIGEGIAGLAVDSTLFQRQGQLVKLIRIPEDEIEFGIKRIRHTPKLIAAKPHYIRELITRRCFVHKIVESDEDDNIRQIAPPDWLYRGITERGHWDDIKTIAGFTEVPILRADGTILNAPGYDPDSKMVYLCDGEPPTIPDKPTHAQAVAARDHLMDVFHDFPFASGHDRAAALVGILTKFCRDCIPGCVPMFLIESADAGTGKGLYCDITGIITTGREMPKMCNPTDVEETRKAITSCLMAGDSTIVLDNIRGTLGNSAIDKALTDTIWQDRILGGNQMGTWPMRIVFYATGNNPTIGGDTFRRIVRIRMEADCENPSERTAFKYPRLKQHVRKNRLDYVIDALTILRAFIVAGRPQAKLPAFGSYDEWSDTVRQAVVWVGMDDPVVSASTLASNADTKRAAFRAMVELWGTIDPHREGLTAAKLIKRVSSGDEWDEFREVLSDLGCMKNGSLDSRQIGNKFREFDGRVVGEYRFGKAGSYKRAVQWVVRKITQSGECGESGESHPPHQEFFPETIPEEEQNYTQGETHSPHSPHSPPARCQDCKTCGFEPATDCDRDDCPTVPPKGADCQIA